MKPCWSEREGEGERGGKEGRRDGGRGREREREREREGGERHTHFDIFLQFAVSSLFIGCHNGKLLGGEVHHLTFDYQRLTALNCGQDKSMRY